jgi:hypothetical protein
MYKGVKTWNPFLGCHYECNYCKPSFQRIISNFTKLRGSDCSGCLNYTPHEHPERLKKIPSAQTIFVCGNGDIVFARPEFVKRIIAQIKRHLERCPYKQFYFQTRKPKCLEQYLDDFPKDNVILITTLETNRDEGYNKVSNAPLLSKRYTEFKNLQWERKVVTIEPIMDFDIDIFLDWIISINPETVWIGYNSRPKSVQLDEPPIEKTKKIIDEIRKNNIVVKEKEMRETIHKNHIKENSRI